MWLSVVLTWYRTCVCEVTAEESGPNVGGVRWERRERGSVRIAGGDEALETCVKTCWVSDGAAAAAAGQPTSSYSPWEWLEWAAVMVAQ